MACQNNAQNTTCQCQGNSNGSCGYIIIIVLYILLAIILGSCFF